MTSPSRFDRDPEALAWARTKIQDYLDRLAEFEQQAKADGDAITHLAYGLALRLTEAHFFGRGSSNTGILTDGPPTAHDGPTVAEAKADDRAYWNSRYES